MAATPLAGVHARSGRAQRDIGGGEKNSHTDLATPAERNLPPPLRPAAGCRARSDRCETTAMCGHVAPQSAKPNEADRQPGRPADAVSEIEWVRHGCAPASRAQQDLGRGP